MSDIQAIRSGLASTLQANVTGFSARNVYQYAPDDGPNQYPFTYLSMREGSVAAPRIGPRQTTHRVLVTTCFSLASGLGTAEKNAEPYVQRVVAAIDQHKTIGTANVSEASVVKYEVTEVRLRPTDQQTYYGIRFTVDVEEIETLAYAA